MKTTDRLYLCFALLCAALLFSGCTSAPKAIQKLNATLIEIDKLGLKSVKIPGRATYTEYRKEEKDGVITSTLTHTNPGLSGPFELVRERTAN